MLEPQDSFDEVLDRALASYGEVAAPEGLDDRVLARVKSTRLVYARWPFLLTLSAALATIMLSLLGWPARPPKLQVVPQAAEPVLTARVVSPPWLPPSRKPAPITMAKTRQIRKQLGAPKLSRFPAPTPLSGEEQALLHLVRTSSKNLPPELTHFGGPVQPIQITALEVKPLQFGWGTEEKTCCDR